MTAAIQTVGVVGLGSMGAGMARALLAAGHVVHAADVESARVDALVALGAVAADPLTSGPLLDVLVVVVLNAEQTEAVLFGKGGWAERLRPGAVIVSCATVPPAFARRMEAAAAAHVLHYLDAPISGGAVRAAEGRLSIMASGRPAAFDAAAPALAAMAEQVHRLGDEAGPGSAMKTVNQLLAGVHIAAMGEALALAVSLGLDLARVLQVISASAGTSWMFENRAPRVVGGDYAPRSAVRIWPKDLGIVTAVADAAGLPVPLAAAALAQFCAAADMGCAGEDDAAVTKVYARAAGLALPGEA